MSDYLSNLAARSLHGVETVRPRLGSLFEPVRPAGESVAMPDLDAHEGIGFLGLERESEPEVPTAPPLRPGARPSPKTVAEVDTQAVTEPAEDEALHPPVGQPRRSQQEQAAGPATTDLPPDATGARHVPRPPVGRRSTIDQSPPRTPSPPAMAGQTQTAPSPLPAPVSPSVLRPAITRPSAPAAEAFDTETYVAPRPSVGSPMTAPPVRAVAAADGETEPARSNRVVPAATDPAGLPSRRPIAWSVIAQPQVAKAPPAAASVPPSPAAQAETTIQVTIGRIEVRAMPAPATPRSRVSAPPVMSLDEYLRQRDRRAPR